MNLPVSINKLSSQLGLTSRTLRHWESEGLFKSIRDHESGWRLYNEEAISCIKIIAILRKLNIPLKDIKVVLEEKSLKAVERAIKKQLLLLDENTTEIMASKNKLNNVLYFLSNLNEYQVSNSLEEISHIFYSGLKHNQGEKKEEEVLMIINEAANNIRFITLPPMRMVYNIAVGASPEDEAMGPVIEWLEISNLMGTARLFGGNVKPFPSKKNLEYGYGMCASIPEEIEVPMHLKEMRIPGGLYAIMPSYDNIYDSWKLLMKYLMQNNEYTSDRSRLCFEEHIRNDNPNGHGSQFIINLLEPIKKNS